MPTDYRAISAYNEEMLGKDRASRMSQVSMYADTAHFVFEILQNADDAGATRLDVWIDWRTHPTERMPDPRMSIFGGPALLIANNSEFTQHDLQAIQRIGESSRNAFTAPWPIDAPKRLASRSATFSLGV